MDEPDLGEIGLCYSEIGDSGGGAGVLLTRQPGRVDNPCDIGQIVTAFHGAWRAWATAALMTLQDHQKTGRASGGRKGDGENA
jgi:hypothetical protein